MLSFSTPVLRLRAQWVRGFGGQEKLKDFVGSLKAPRKAIILVPAGKATDAVIEDLAGLFEKGDIIIDAGTTV